MPAYLIVNVDITDPERYQEYRKAATPTVEAFGGRYLARGGHAETIEGDWTPHRMVILEFDSVEKAKEWWSSDVYRAPKKIRHESSNTQMLVVDGL